MKEAIVNIYTFTAIIKTQLQHVPIEQIIRSNPQILFAQSNTYEIIMCLVVYLKQQISKARKLSFYYIFKKEYKQESRNN